MPGARAIHGFESDISLTDARRATTRVLPRVDALAGVVAPRHPGHESGAGVVRRRAGMGAWLSGVFQRYRPEPPRTDVSSPTQQHQQRRPAWLLDTVLPPLSLVLFGSGIGAGIMLLLQPDRGAESVQAQTVQALRRCPPSKTPGDARGARRGWRG